MNVVAALPAAKARVASIVARGLCADYGRGEMRLRVLSGVDLDVWEGGISAFIGPSGCGKSTLLKVLAGLLPASAGQVRWPGWRRRRRHGGT